MEVLYYSKDKTAIKDKSAVALGMFDGVHLGHKQVINKAITYAKNHGIKSAVITLSKHPREFTSGSAPELITDLESRLMIFARLGLDYALVLDFNEELMNTSAGEYLDKFLINYLHAEFISTGYDHHFGKGREGNIEFLKNWTQQKQIELNVEESFKIQAEIVSSSRIREFIKIGDIRKANEFLGHDFFVYSKVIHGDKKGSEIGFPTANLEISNKLLIPKTGVYKGKCLIEGEDLLRPCAINLGYRPSLGDTQKLSLEAHIINFSGDIYGKKLELRFENRIRDEQKFNSIEELRLQIQRDLFQL